MIKRGRLIDKDRNTLSNTDSRGERCSHRVENFESHSVISSDSIASLTKAAMTKSVVSPVCSTVSPESCRSAQTPAANADATQSVTADSQGFRVGSTDVSSDTTGAVIQSPIDTQPPRKRPCRAPQLNTEARCEYIQNTHMPIGGWFQSCRRCRAWTGNSVTVSLNIEVPLCRRCVQAVEKQARLELDEGLSCVSAESLAESVRVLVENAMAVQRQQLQPAS